MVAIADGGLRHLGDQRLRVAEKQMLQRASELELGLERFGSQAVGAAGALNDGAAGCGLTTHEQRDAHQTFIADDRDLCRRSVFHDVQQRHDRAIGKYT